MCFVVGNQVAYPTLKPEVFVVFNNVTCCRREKEQRNKIYMSLDTPTTMIDYILGSRVMEGMVSCSKGMGEKRYGVGCTNKYKKKKNRRHTLDLRFSKGGRFRGKR